MKPKYLFVLISVALALTTLRAYAGGGSVRGGGDVCEDRIKVIRDDLREWINKGGPKDLILPIYLSESKYSSAMLNEILLAKIRCVSQGDQNYPVTVEGTPKVCRFDQASVTNPDHWITCDANKFQSLSESDQYVLIHHEYAGLSGIEEPVLDDSTYNVSNQISDYLVNAVVKKLAVKGQFIGQYQSHKYIMCSYNGAPSAVVKIKTSDLDVGKCPVILPSTLKDFQFRVSRQKSSGLLRLVIENVKTGFWTSSLGGNDQITVNMALSKDDSRTDTNHLGIAGSTLDELLQVSCEPNWGTDFDFYTLVEGSNSCDHQQNLQ